MVSFTVISTLFLVSSCRDTDPEAEHSSYKLGYCQKSPDLKAFKEVSRAEAKIVGFRSNPSNPDFEACIMEFPEAPTGYVNPFNLPGELGEDGIKIRFSGQIYVPSNLNLGQIPFVPIELSSVKKIN